MSEPRKLKRVVIKEELVALTGSFVKAVLLQQLIYWSEYTKDSAKFVEEELRRAREYGLADGLQGGQEDLLQDLRHGWVYKTAEDLSAETMLGMAPNTIRRYLKELVESGYLLERKNPRFRWDRTLQYRADLLKIQRDLLAMGYPFEGYAIDLPAPDHGSESHRGKGEGTGGSQDSPDPNCQSISAPLRFSKTCVQTSKMENYKRETRGAIPEITAEITTENYIYAKSPPPPPINRPLGDCGLPGSCKQSVPYSQIVEEYHRCCKSLPGIIKLTSTRKRHLAARWKELGSVDAFVEVFRKAEASDFLTNRHGSNRNGWRCTFDWLINESNMTKVLEGKYDNQQREGDPSRSGAACEIKKPEFSGWGEIDRIPDYVRQIAEKASGGSCGGKAFTP